MTSSTGLANLPARTSRIQTTEWCWNSTIKLCSDKRCTDDGSCRDYDVRLVCRLPLVLQCHNTAAG
jgi:hypothetical protein